uniref:CARD domain-containing protein n=1 Tax=Plectus sambesii TaxID=2011161 RepID=A0A914WMC2_9BILA
MPLDETLKRSLDESRKDICADLNMNELVNQYLHDLLSPDEVSDIKDARGSDKTQMFFIAVKKNIRRIITFMIGLKETHHEDRFHYFCTKEFCDKLVSVLDKP